MNVAKKDKPKGLLHRSIKGTGIVALGLLGCTLMLGMAFVIVGAPFLLVNPDHALDTTFWLCASSWWLYASGAIAAVGRYQGRDWDYPDDTGTFLVLFGSWLAWFILGATRKGRNNR